MKYTAEQDARIKDCTDAKALAEEFGVSVACIYARRNKLFGPKKQNLKREDVEAVRVCILKHIANYTRMADTFEAVANELNMSAWTVRYIYEKKLYRRLA